MEEKGSNLPFETTSGCSHIAKSNVGRDDRRRSWYLGISRRWPTARLSCVIQECGCTLCVIGLIGPSVSLGARGVLALRNSRYLAIS